MRARGETGWVAAFAIGLVAWSACGGKIEPERVGSTDTPPGSTSSGSSSSSSSGSSGTPPTGVDGAGSVPCGAGIACTTPAESCCSDGADLRCVAPSTPPGSIACPGAVIACDQPADCPSDHPICCWIPMMGGQSGWSSRCVDSCIRDSITFEACATDSDCRETKGPCTTHQCGGHTYRFCQQVTQLCSP